MAMVQVRVQKHGFAPPLRPNGSKDDWRTNICIVDLLTALPVMDGVCQVFAIQGHEYLRLGRRRYAWSVQEWDGDR